MRVVLRGIVRAVALPLTVATGLSVVLLVGGMESLAANPARVGLVWMASVAVLALLAGLFWLADARLSGSQLQRGSGISSGAGVAKVSVARKMLSSAPSAQSFLLHPRAAEARHTTKS